MSAARFPSKRPPAAEIGVAMIADEYGAKAVEMDGKADQCFSIEAADMYRALAAEWRHLQAKTIAWQQRTAPCAVIPSS